VRLDFQISRHNGGSSNRSAQSPAILTTTAAAF
jgi:hypothetical protein